MSFNELNNLFTELNAEEFFEINGGFGAVHIS